MRYINGFISLFVLYIITSCANPVGPTGGDKDTQSPLILKIDTLTKNKQKYVRIQFDENINFKNNIHFIPYTKITSDQLKIENQSITVRIPENLNAISLNESISDVNENNLGHYPFIILGKDTSKQTLQIQHPLKDNKIKIKGYTLIDTLIYRGDNFINNSIRFEALKADSQYFHVYADQNNNDKLDETEYYYINKIKPSPDTIKTQLYPPLQNPIFVNHQTNNKYSIYISQNNQFKKITDSLDEYLIHLDTFLILKTDSNKIKRLLLQSSITLKPTKASISDTKKEIIYQNKLLTDTNIYKEYFVSQLLNIDTLMYPYLPYFNNIKTTIVNVKPNSVPKNKLKLGELILQNDSFETLYVSIYQNNKNIYSEELNIGNKSIHLPIGKYQILAWLDKNKNNYCDHTEYNYEKIVQYYSDINVNEKLSNIYILHKSNKPSSNVNLNVNIATPDIE